MTESANTNLSGSDTSRYVFKLGSDLVTEKLGEIRTRLKQLIAEGVRELVLDMSTVEMVDSAGIGLILSAHNSLQKVDGALEIIYVRHEIRELFHTMRMHRRFRISEQA